MNLEEEKLIDFLDTFFDQGFKIVKIDKKEFDSLKTKDIMKFQF